METILAEQGLRLSYLRNPSKSDAFDPCRILDDLCEDGMAGAMLPWQNGLRMAASDHLIVATGIHNGRCFGVVAASDLATEREPFLFLDAAYLAPVARASHLLQRMLAFAMLRVAGNAAVPNVIAACVQTPCYARSLRDIRPALHRCIAVSRRAGRRRHRPRHGVAGPAHRARRAASIAPRCRPTACSAPPLPASRAMPASRPSHGGDAGRRST